MNGKHSVSVFGDSAINAYVNTRKKFKKWPLEITHSLRGSEEECDTSITDNLLNSVNKTGCFMQVEFRRIYPGLCLTVRYRESFFLLL